MDFDAWMNRLTPEISFFLILTGVFALIYLATMKTATKAAAAFKRVGVFVVLLFLVGVGAGNVHRANRDPGVVLAPSAEARLAVGDWRLLSFPKLEQVDLSSLRGKVVVINIWATWCGPCLSEMPSFQALYDQFAKDPSIAFLFVSTDRDTLQLNEFLRNASYRLPIYIPGSIPPGDFMTEGIPATFVLDKKGAMRIKHVGAQNWASDDVVIALKSLIKEP